MSLSNQSEESGTPATPSAGRQLLYPKAAGGFTKNSAGVEEQISGSLVHTKPAFSAKNNGTQAISAGAVTLVNLGTETFDTNSNFASSVFTPTIAGKYLITGIITFSAASAPNISGYLHKNGALARDVYATGLATTFMSITVSAILDMNGSSDYVDLRMFTNQAGTLQVAYLDGCKID